MADILIAYSSRHPRGDRAWSDLVTAIARGRQATSVMTEDAPWRYNGDWYPDVQRGDRVYVVYNRLVRGHAPLLDVLERAASCPNETRLLLDTSKWEAHGLEWPYGPEFARSWRYARFTLACHTPFPAWATDPGLATHGPRIRPMPRRTLAVAL